MVSDSSMNASYIQQWTSTSHEAAFASHTLAVVLWVVVAVNAVGIFANGFLLVSLVLLHGKGYLSVASVQMLVQQASVDFILNALSIAYD